MLTDFKLGEYVVRPREGRIEHDGEVVRVKPKSMAVLECLADADGKVVSRNVLMDMVWPSMVVTDDVLTQSVVELRKAFGDSARDAQVIETIPKVGFKLIPAVTPFSPEVLAPEPTPEVQEANSVVKQLYQRKMFRIAVGYLAVSWALWEVVTATCPAFECSNTFQQSIFWILLAGLPITLAVAWVNWRTAILVGVGILTGASVMFFVMRGTLPTAPMAPPTRQPVLQIHDRRSIAVLPFENLSQDEATIPFTLGIHDDVLTHIAKIKSIKTISRNSVLQYRDSIKTIRQIADELGVATVLQGGVQRSGDRVRVNVRVIDATTDEHLWAETYDRELTALNIFTIQSEIAMAVAGALQVALSPEERGIITAVPTDNLAAYEAYLLGRQRFWSLSAEGLAEAIDYFQQANKLDPKFALPYLGLADAHILQRYFGGAPHLEMFKKAEAAIEKAQQLGDRSAELYTSLGLLKFQQKDYEEAEAAFELALKLNPNHAPAYDWYGNMFRELGRYEDAIALFEKSILLDPLHNGLHMSAGLVLIELGRFDEAMTRFEKMLEIDPDNHTAYWGIGQLYWTVYGRLDEAVSWYRKAVALEPTGPMSNGFLSLLYADLGDYSRAECWADRAMQFAPESYWANSATAIVHRYRGEESEALAAAEKSLQAGYGDDYSSSISNQILRNHDLRGGDFATARARYQRVHPELLAHEPPTIDATNYRKAIDLAYVLQQTGELERAELLLNRALAFLPNLPRLGGAGYWLSDVSIYALQGQTQRALSALRQALDEGWRCSLELDPNLASLHDEPEFQAMVDELKADIAGQLKQVKELDLDVKFCANS